ncbi:hypothetical protein AVEN_115359-1 [Araneus ventricosus]|uniref:Uncharacterized protein n=1 Tax=Araneus ventricosus TaxID=182803 RepID=A0A4Y1ZY84_ARAVE|nr:hypothetical protein AVEN_115359-1 [Araneus ventricosus]
MAEKEETHETALRCLSLTACCSAVALTVRCFSCHIAYTTIALEKNAITRKEETHETALRRLSLTRLLFRCSINSPVLFLPHRLHHNCFGEERYYREGGDTRDSSAPFVLDSLVVPL